MEGFSVYTQVGEVVLRIHIAYRRARYLLQV